jgi:hypothetical protein
MASIHGTPTDPQQPCPGKTIELSKMAEERVLPGCIASMMVIDGLAAGTWTISRNAAEAARWVAHSHALLNSLTEAEADALRILTTQNFRLTGNTALLVKRDAIVDPLIARALRGETIPDMDGGLDVEPAMASGTGRGAAHRRRRARPGGMPTAPCRPRAAA